MIQRSLKIIICLFSLHFSIVRPPEFQKLLNGSLLAVADIRQVNDPKKAFEERSNTCGTTGRADTTLARMRRAGATFYLATPYSRTARAASFCDAGNAKRTRFCSTTATEWTDLMIIVNRCALARWLRMRAHASRRRRKRISTPNPSER